MGGSEVLQEAILPSMGGPDANVALSMRAAATAIGMTPIVVRRSIDRGDLGNPVAARRPAPAPAQSRPSPGAQADHGTLTRYAMGCNCDACLTAQRDYQREKVRAEAQARFPQELRMQLLDALGSGVSFKRAVADVGLSSHRVWGLAQHDPAWSQALDGVLQATRDPQLRHGTGSAYAAGCVCRECRNYNRERGVGRRR